MRADILNKAACHGELAPARLSITEWSDRFEILMRNRLIMGAMRYSKLAEPRPPGISDIHLRYIEQRLETYKQTGNTEMLVDIANICLVEFEKGDHSLKHFKAIERED